MTARGRRLAALGRATVKTVIALLAIALMVVAAAAVSLRTDWAKNELRNLLVAQANRYLIGTLEIGRLEGSLYEGVELRDVRLLRSGRAVVEVEAVRVTYGIRQLFQPTTSIRELRLTRPRVYAVKENDGRWNLATLVQRQTPPAQPQGPPRAFHIGSIEITDGTVELASPVTFGAVRVPTRFDDLDASFSLDRTAEGWRVSFEQASWAGATPDLAVTRFAGSLAGDGDGLLFDRLAVETPRSAFTLDGRLHRGGATTLNLRVSADRFAFQEWAGIVSGLRNIAVEARFDVALDGPLDALAADLDLESSGGGVRGGVTLNTRIPGWHASGTVDLTRLDLARWLNRRERASDITGQVEFDLDLDLGRRFPRGSYAFRGPHVAYMGYEADDVRARGSITASDVLIQDSAATAYGASVNLTAGSIGIDDPFPFRFEGSTAGVDLRRLPETVPVPRVESTLDFEYGIDGRFASPFVRADVRFDESVFLGATIEAGAVGAFDSSAELRTYGGEGSVGGIDLQRFAADLELEWLRDPRFAGTVTGRFRVEGAGAGADSLVLTAGGRLMRADLFGGTFSDGYVSLEIGAGSLRASYDGSFDRVNPSVAMGDSRFEASLGGRGEVRIAVRDLFVREPQLEDYDISGAVELSDSTAHGIRLDAATVAASLSSETLVVSRLHLVGPEVDAEGSGTIELGPDRSSRFDYHVARADLSLLGDAAGRDIAGQVQTLGIVTGPTESLRLLGDASINDLADGDVSVQRTTGSYDVTLPSLDVARMTAKTSLQASAIEAFGRAFAEAAGDVSYAEGRLEADLGVGLSDETEGRMAGVVNLKLDRQSLDVLELTVAVQRISLGLVTADPPPSISWDDGGIAIDPITLVGTTGGTERLDLSGTWRTDGTGSLHVVANGFYLDTLAAAEDGPTAFGGALGLDAVLRGTREQPIVTGNIAVADGRVRRLAYEKLEGRVEYFDGLFEVNLRLDQSPGVWLAARGTVPLGFFDPTQPEQTMHVAIVSTSISLGLVEGLTGVVREVTGQVRLDLTATGSSVHPDLLGSIDVEDAGFLVTATGVRYGNGRAHIELSKDRIVVDSAHVEDSRGQPLDIRGSLGTHELRLQDLELEVTGKRLEVLRNEFGTAEGDIQLLASGRIESPRLTGMVTILGGELIVDRILDRALFQPYATEAQAPIADLDALAALNPWDQLGLDIELHVPGSLRMTGDNVQVSPGTPLGLGDINLRATGDLYLYKDPGQPLYVTGSLDQITGAYVFQGRRFDLDPRSSIVFRGDLSPDLYVTVRRLISGVEARVSIEGPLQEPELRLTSTPPLDPSDVLSLIVFNTTTNQLSSSQQEQLAVRAGTLAAAFLASPLVSALERTLGLETLGIEPATGNGGGARITVGDEIAPGLVARFSRQFGQYEYDEVTLEYYLSRILRIRGTLSDATALTVGSPFRRVERAGIDLLVFFSF